MQEIQVRLIPSKQFILLLFLVAFGGSWICFMLPISGIFQLLLGCAVILYAGKILYVDALLRHENSIVGLSWNQNGWQLHCKNQTIFAGHLRLDSTVTNWVSVLRFSVAGRFFPVSCLIWQDSLSADLYRKLRVKLLYR